MLPHFSCCKKWPLKLCARLWVLREIDFQSHKLNTIWTRRFIHNTSQGVIASLVWWNFLATILQPKQNQMSFTIMQMTYRKFCFLFCFVFPFFFYIRNTEIDFQHIGLSIYVRSKGPTHEDILSIYALYIYSVHIYLYAKVINDQYQQ